MAPCASQLECFRAISPAPLGRGRLGPLSRVRIWAVDRLRQTCVAKFGMSSRCARLRCVLLGIVISTSRVVLGKSVRDRILHGCAASYWG
eukprot:5610465-Pyramimonas_sp.AAC.1